MGLKVLCIDDSKSVHVFLKQCLLELDPAFDSVFDGEQAVECIRAGKTDYSVIFLDWEMPKKNGPETFDELKRLGLTVPVIMLTSKNSQENISQMLSAGVAEYIMKPFTKEIVVEKILSILN